MTTKKIIPILIPPVGKRFLPYETQANLLLDHFRKIAKPSEKLGLIFSANLGQMNDAQEKYGIDFSQSGGSINIQGSGQAGVFMAIERSLKRNKYPDLMDRFYTIPLPTMKYQKTLLLFSSPQPLASEEIEEGLQYLKTFLGKENTVLFALMRRNKTEVEPAIGGGVSKEVAAEYIEYIQTSIQAKIDLSQLVILQPSKGIAP